MISGKNLGIHRAVHFSAYAIHGEKKKKKEKREKMDELRSFFSVSIVRISTFVTRVCFSARMYNDSILRKQRENPGNGRERTKKKKIRKREVNDETRRH